jgi:hypothetical protein
MSINSCYTYLEYKSDLDKLGNILSERYNKNIETVLNVEDETLLNNVSEQLELLSRNNGIQFNKDLFKSFVKRLYVYDFAQFGGGPHNQIVPHGAVSNRRESSSRSKTVYLTNKYDLFAIIAFAVGIFIMYISFVKFNELSQSVIGMDIASVSEDVKLQIQEALSEIQKLPTEKITFSQYVLNSIQTFSCSIIEQQAQRIRNIVVELLSNSVQDFTAIAEEICMPRTEVFTEGAYSVSSSLGTFDFGRALNSIVQVASSVSSASTTSACITNTALTLQQKTLNDLFYNQQLILNKITSQTTQAITFFSYGVSLGTSGALYLIYRTKDVLRIAYAQRQQVKGGKKYTKKNKKHKKYKKIYSRKNKKRTHKRR